jgi:hypothetical protein
MFATDTEDDIRPPIRLVALLPPPIKAIVVFIGLVLIPGHS